MVSFLIKIWHQEFLKDREISKIYREYFDLETLAVRSRLFDVIAHPDLIKKYFNQLAPYVSYDLDRNDAGPFIEALVDCQVGIDVNTKGLKLPVGEIYPSVQFLSD